MIGSAAGETAARAVRNTGWRWRKEERTRPSVDEVEEQCVE